MEIGEQACKQNPSIKNDTFTMRCEREWKEKVQDISKNLGVSSSVFIRDSVNKNITSLTQ